MLSLLFLRALTKSPQLLGFSVSSLEKRRIFFFLFLFSLFLLFPCRLGIQLDENEDLKALLEETLREGGDNLKLYQVLVEQQRDKFSQDIWQHKQGKN